jgi:hypothetical protein
MAQLDSQLGGLGGYALFELSVSECVVGNQNEDQKGEYGKCERDEKRPLNTRATGFDTDRLRISSDDFAVPFDAAILVAIQSEMMR